MYFKRAKQTELYNQSALADQLGMTFAAINYHARRYSDFPVPTFCTRTGGLWTADEVESVKDYFTSKNLEVK